MVLPGRDGVPSPSAAGGGTPALPDRPNPATGLPSTIPTNVSANPSAGGSWLRSKFITSFFNAATRSIRIASSALRKYASSAATSPFAKSRRRALLRATPRPAHPAAVQAGDGCVMQRQRQSPPQSAAQPRRQLLLSEISSYNSQSLTAQLLSILQSSIYSKTYTEKPDPFVFCLAYPYHIDRISC